MKHNLARIWEEVGFALVEIMIVAAIIALLITMMIP